MIVQDLINTFDGWAQYVLSKGWIVQIFVVILLTAVIHLVKAIAFKRIQRKVEKTKNYWDDAFVHGINKPLGIVIWIVGITFAGQVAAKSATANIGLFSSMPVFRELGITLMMIWGLLRFVKKFENNLISRHQGKRQFDKTSVNAIGQILRVSVLVTGILICLSILGVPLSAVAS